MCVDYMNGREGRTEYACVDYENGRERGTECLYVDCRL